VNVVGLDLSLTSTGVAGTTCGDVWTARIRPPAKLTGHDRLNYIRRTILDFYLPGVALVVVEGPSLRSPGKYAHESAGLWWLVTHSLWRAKTPTAIVPPNNRAQYATGLGDANKREVIASVAELFPWFNVGRRPGLADEADALVLAAMGCDWAGEPLVVVPAKHRAALDGCVWPTLPPKSPLSAAVTVLGPPQRVSPAADGGATPGILP
jgi:Holliday junction resolvasome RuvABC endonuclease subunit